MTTFYSVSNGEKPIWIAAREDSGEHRMLVWVANDQTWRRHVALEAEFYALDRDMVFEEISPGAAAKQLLAWPKLNLTTAGWILDQLLEEPAITSTQLGLPTKRGKRPTRSVLNELIGNPGVWVIVQAYDDAAEESKRRARVLASEIRTGKKVSLHIAGAYVESRTRDEAGSTLVEAKLLHERNATAGS
jgi:hypothetical protein